MGKHECWGLQWLNSVKEKLNRHYRLGGVRTAGSEVLLPALEPEEILLSPFDPQPSLLYPGLDAT